jgi:hypothetical protein
MRQTANFSSIPAHVSANFADPSQFQANFKAPICSFFKHFFSFIQVQPRPLWTGVF